MAAAAAVAESRPCLTCSRSTGPQSAVKNKQRVLRHNTTTQGLARAPKGAAGLHPDGAEAVVSNVGKAPLQQVTWSQPTSACVCVCVFLCWACDAFYEGGSRSSRNELKQGGLFWFRDRLPYLLPIPFATSPFATSDLIWCFISP